MTKYCITIFNPETGGSNVIVTEHPEEASEYEMMGEIDGEIVFVNEFEAPDKRGK